MDSDLVAIAARHLERLLIVIAGGLSIVLGYRMFLAIPRAAKDEGEGKLELPGGISVYVTRVGPGVFFALFGAVILGLGLQQGLKLEVREQRPAAGSQAGADVPTVATVTERRYSSLAPAGASGQQGEAERTSALDTVGQLSRLAAALDGPGRGGGLSPQQRLDFGLALSDARLRLLASVWDERWGAYTEFVRWAEAGAGGPPPAGAEPAARVYRAGR
jgi:hypothetical protein